MQGLTCDSREDNSAFVEGLESWAGGDNGGCGTGPPVQGVERRETGRCQGLLPGRGEGLRLEGQKREWSINQAGLEERQVGSQEGGLRLQVWKSLLTSSE